MRSGIVVCRSARLILNDEYEMIEHLMTASPVTIGPDEPVQRAAQLMDEFNVGALPVCKESRLVGLVTDRDITVRATAAGLNPHLTLVHQVMSSPVRCCLADNEVSEVLRLMAIVQIRRVPVVDGNKVLVGIVSLGDLAERFTNSSSEVLRCISTPAQPDRAPLPPHAGTKEALLAPPTLKTKHFP